jgi:hypothetical protein
MCILRVFFPLLAVLGFEFRALCLLGRHLSHAPSPCYKFLIICNSISRKLINALGKSLCRTELVLEKEARWVHDRQELEWAVTCAVVGLGLAKGYGQKRRGQGVFRYLESRGLSSNWIYGSFWRNNTMGKLRSMWVTGWRGHASLEGLFLRMTAMPTAIPGRTPASQAPCGMSPSYSDCLPPNCGWLGRVGTAEGSQSAGCQWLPCDLTEETSWTTQTL